MPDPEVVVVMQQFRQSLLQRDAAQMQAMTHRWMGVEHALEGRMQALAEDASRRRAGGETISQAKLMQMDRYRSLLGQVQQELRTYTDYATPLITDTQREYAALGIQHAAKAIEAAAPGIQGSFDIPPVGAVENMVGLAGDGSPLRSLLVDTWPDAAEGMTQELIRSVALGLNPRETARRMAEGTTRTLNRMMVISRTEQLRVYRQSNLESYRKSGVVSGFRRLAAKSSRTCIACLMADGEYYTLDESLREHASGRCVLLPVISGMPELQWTKGPDWFMEQDVQTQTDILGKGHFAAWKDGKFYLEQLVSLRQNDTWGDSLHPTSLQDLLAGLGGGVIRMMQP